MIVYGKVYDVISVCMIYLCLYLLFYFIMSTYVGIYKFHIFAIIS